MTKKPSPPAITPRQQSLLVAVANDLRHWRSQFKKLRYANHRGTPEWHRGVLASRHGEVRIDLHRWLGEDPSSAQRMRASRDLKALEAAGLLERVADGGRVTEVRLTNAGAAAARKKR